MRANRTSPWRHCGRGLILIGLLYAGCVLGPSPRQMYEGPRLPREQVAIVRSGCVPEGGLTIMIVGIDGKAITDTCADFALLPGDHRLDLMAERRAPRLGSPMMGSGGVLGAPPSATSGGGQQGPGIIWQSQTPLTINCATKAGTEVLIVGTIGTGQDWVARCQELAR